jgi:hypothetical protein
MRILFIVLLVFVTGCASAQRRKVNSNNPAEPKPVAYILDKKAMDNIDSRKILKDVECWQLFADSINAFARNGITPIFLLDPCFDWTRSSRCDPTLHSKTSVRWEAISRVITQKPLHRLLKEMPAMIKVKCNRRWEGPAYPGDLTPDLNQYSTYELIVKRLKQLGAK